MELKVANRIIEAFDVLEQTQDRIRELLYTRTPELVTDEVKIEAAENLDSAWLEFAAALTLSDEA